MGGNDGCQDSTRRDVMCRMVSWNRCVSGSIALSAGSYGLSRKRKIGCPLHLRLDCLQRGLRQRIWIRAERARAGSPVHRPTASPGSGIAGTMRYSASSAGRFARIHEPSIAPAGTRAGLDVMINFHHVAAAIHATGTPYKRRAPPSIHLTKCKAIAAKPTSNAPPGSS